MDFGKKTKIETQRNTETQMSIITAGSNFREGLCKRKLILIIGMIKFNFTKETLQEKTFSKN